MKSKDPCKPFACKIQACLKGISQIIYIVINYVTYLLPENSYQESACQQAIEDMRNCCRKWGELSFVCGGIKTDPVDAVASKK